MPTPKRITVAGNPEFKTRRDLPCRNYDPDLWYSDAPTEQQKAARICQRCPAQRDCLLFALDHDLCFGIWGGHTPAERKAIVEERNRRTLRPHVVLPDPPARAAQPWKWPGARRAVDVGRVLDAARRVLDGELMRTVEAATGLHNAVLGEGVAVLRWAPDLEDDVRDGWIPMKTAARHGRQVRDAYTAAGAHPNGDAAKVAA